MSDLSERALASLAEAGALFREGERVVVALSGGADSCALLLALAEIFPRKLAGALHFHHGMRGADADADAGFCAALCARLGVPCLISFGALGREASEGAARDARYEFLAKGAREMGADLIATGHTQDDVAETVLLRVLRGTSVDGLAGIPARRSLRDNISVVRPFLAVRRAETEALCVARSVKFRTDPTNANLSFPRNRLRATLPALAESFNPRLVEALGRLANLADADARLLDTLSDDLMQAARTDDGWSVEALCDAPLALRRRVLLRALREASEWGAEERATAGWVFALERVLRVGGSFDLPGGVRVSVSGGTLRFSIGIAPREPYALVLDVPGEAAFPGGRVVSTLGAPSGDYRPGALWIEAPDTMRAESALVLRPARPGEKLAPLGMNGKHRLVRDLMADAGWSVAERERRPVLAFGETILWIPGVRVGEALRLPPQTERVARIEIFWEESC